MLRNVLLACGVLASLLYVGTDVAAAICYPAYHSFTARAISELMATGAPTERLVDPPFLFYDVLMMAFAVGVWRSVPTRRAHITAGLLFTYAALGLLGPTVFEMNVRGSGAPPMADYLHMAITGVLVVIIFAIVATAAILRGRAFRIYSYATIVTMIAFGIVTGMLSKGLGTTEQTPWLGAAERVNIGAFLLWVAVLAVSLLRASSREPAPAFPSGLRPAARG